MVRSVGCEDAAGNGLLVVMSSEGGDLLVLVVDVVDDLVMLISDTGVG